MSCVTRLSSRSCVRKNTNSEGRSKGQISKPKFRRFHLTKKSKKLSKLVLYDSEAERAQKKGKSPHAKILAAQTPPSGSSILELLQGFPTRWISFNIDGVRARVIFTTYDTWPTVPLLPQHTPWEWAGLAAADIQGLMPLEVVARFSDRINERLNSPTACYLDSDAAASHEVLPGSAGVHFATFFHDQQDCVLWSAVGPAGAEVVVAHHEPITTATDFRVNVTCIVESAGVEAFLYRMYLEGAVWHARSGFDRNQDSNEKLPEDVWVYEQLLIETHKSDPKLSFNDAF